MCPSSITGITALQADTMKTQYLSVPHPLQWRPMACGSVQDWNLDSSRKLKGDPDSSGGGDTEPLEPACLPAGSVVFRIPCPFNKCLFHGGEVIGFWRLQVRADIMASLSSVQGDLRGL